MRLIDADALLNDPANISSNEFGDDVVYVEDINNAPTIEAYTPDQVQDLIALNKKLSEERPHGEWKQIVNDINLLKCSECGCVTGEQYPFCPQCGADMRKSGESER